MDWWSREEYTPAGRDDFFLKEIYSAFIESK
jgi:hypothetical protein